MATTTATIILNSVDLLSDELALSTSATLTAADTATGITQASGLSRKKLASGHAEYVLYDGSAYTADKAHKVYLKNTSTTATEFFLLTVNAEEIGRLYAGDWMFIPWSAEDSGADVKVTPSVSSTMKLEYVLVHE